MYNKYSKIVEEANWAKIFNIIRNGDKIENFVSDSGMTPLARAISDDNYLVAERLFSVGANALPIKLTNNLIFSPLWAAMERKNSKIVNLLLENGADPNERHYNNINITPLEWVSFQAEEDMVVSLCKHGADTNQTGNATRSPLHIWIEHIGKTGKGFSAFYSLIDNGANPNAVDSFGRDCLSIAGKSWDNKLDGTHDDFELAWITLEHCWFTNKYNKNTGKTTTSRKIDKI